MNQDDGSQPKVIEVQVLSVTDADTEGRHGRYLSIERHLIRAIKNTCILGYGNLDGQDLIISAEKPIITRPSGAEITRKRHEEDAPHKVYS